MKRGATKPHGNVGLIPCLQSSVRSLQKPHQVSKECHFLAGAGTSGYFGDLIKRNLPKSTGIAGMSDGKCLAWLGLASGLERLLKVQPRDSL